jgi:hypothetical protein
VEQIVKGSHYYHAIIILLLQEYLQLTFGPACATENLKIVEKIWYILALQSVA